MDYLIIAPFIFLYFVGFFAASLVCLYGGLKAYDFMAMFVSMLWPAFFVVALVVMPFFLLNRYAEKIHKKYSAGELK